MVVKPVVMEKKVFWNKTDYLDYAKLAKLESENTSLKFEIDRLTALADRLQTENEQLKNQITNDARAATMVIDFGNMDVFSVERVVGDSGPMTTIGHWVVDADGVKSSAEWVLHCTTETHEKLANEFKNSIKNSENE